MIDPAGAALLALMSHSPAAIGLVFAAGVVTSVGPCVAPRYVAIVALVNGGRRPLTSTLAFVAGLIAALAALGFGAGWLGSLWSVSGLVDALLAVSLVGGGAVMLVGAVPPSHAPQVCAAHAATHAHRSLGGTFLLGAASALVISPCCTPVIGAIVATSTAIGQPGLGVVLLVTYAAGHALPLFFTGAIGAAARRLPLSITAQAPAIVGAVLMLALGIYYGLLA